MEKKKHNLQTYIFLGYLYRNQQNLPFAIQNFEKGFTFEWTEAERNEWVMYYFDYVCVATMLAAVNYEADKAAESTKKGIELFPDHADKFKTKLGFIYNSQHKYKGKGRWVNF